MTQGYVEEFGRARIAPAPGWLVALRDRGMAQFSAVGFPTLREEDWRFTDVGPIAKATFAPAPAPVPGQAVTQGAIGPFAFGAEEGIRLAFVNGRFTPALSIRPLLPSGVTVAPLAEALNIPVLAGLIEGRLGTLAPAEMTPFAALNAALHTDGALVHVPAGVALTPAIHLLMIAGPDAAGSMAHLRSLIVLERGASAKVVEHYVSLSEGPGPGLVATRGRTNSQ